MKVETNNLITVHEYAKSLGKSTTWIYKLIQKGDLKAVKVGRATLIVIE